MAQRALMKEKSFDEFLMGISFADLDVELMEDDYDLGLHEGYDIAPLSIARDTAAATFSSPLASPTSVDCTMRRHGDGKAATARTRRRDTMACTHRRRDRRRNEGQRERENAKRKIKQEEFLRKRSKCFEAEFELRDHLRRVVVSVMRERKISTTEAIATLPEEVRFVMARAEAVMKRYRTFTGQKRISEQLNQFPTWTSSIE